MHAIVYLALALVRKSAPPSPADTEQRCRLSLKQRVRHDGRRCTRTIEPQPPASSQHSPPEQLPKEPPATRSGSPDCEMH